MEWGILAIGIIFALVGYVIIQGTRATLAWRRAAARGEVDVIRQMLDETINSWRSMKRPKEVPLEVWRGVQTVELIDVGADSARVSCQADGEYRMIEGRWVEVASPLQLGMAITVRLVDMLLYEVPNLRLDNARVDVYTTFRDSDHAERVCILTTTASREVARKLDWDEWPADEIVSAFGGRYRLGDRGEALPLDLEDEQPPVFPNLGVQPER